VGREGDGFQLAQQRLGPGRIHHCMRWLGQSRRAFDMLCERAVSRYAHGSVLAEKQTVQNWVADSLAEMQAARLMTLHAAWKMDQEGQAAARVGVRSVVVVPTGSSPLKMDRIRGFGAELRVSGADIGEAAQTAREAALAEGLVYVEDGEDPELMAGAATVGWEILEDLPAAQAIVVPVGGGNLIAGVALAAKRLKPSVKIIGVQSDAAPAVVRSWELRRLVEMPCATFAGGLATPFPGKLAFQVILDLVDEMYLVSEAELRAEIRNALATRATLIEGAAAAPFAALRRFGAAWPTRTVLIQTGANLSLTELQWVLAGEENGTGKG